MSNKTLGEFQVLKFSENMTQVFRNEDEKRRIKRIEAIIKKAYDTNIWFDKEDFNIDYDNTEPIHRYMLIDEIDNGAYLYLSFLETADDLKVEIWEAAHSENVILDIYDLDSEAWNTPMPYDIELKIG